ncbi:OsmC family protein [Nitriliruptor alkaliphilus]|uniref:OsmC family protein n=1 Tax=Nitriliruptor alkaliphilus TaxID=427918 RepID=UPI0009F8C52D
MTGTLGGALEARGIPAGGGRLRSDITGEVELEGKTLVLKRVHAAYTLEVDEDADRDAIDRVLGFHADRCPVARSIRAAIEITTSIELTAAS